jgi:hypothetical protein
MRQWIGRFERRDPYRLALAAAVANIGQFFEL